MTRTATRVTLLAVGLTLIVAGLIIGFFIPLNPRLPINCGTAFQPHAPLGVANILTCGYARTERMPLAITPLILGSLTLIGALLLTLTTRKE